MNWSQLPIEYRDLATQTPNAYLQNDDDILYRFIVAFLPHGVNFWMQCRDAKDVSELPPIPKTISQEEIQKDIALFVSFFYFSNYSSMNLLASFDIVYSMAKSFVEKYPPNTDWEESDIDYETAAAHFIEINFTNKEF